MYLIVFVEHEETYELLCNWSIWVTKRCLTIRSLVVQKMSKNKFLSLSFSGIADQCKVTKSCCRLPIVM